MLIRYKPVRLNGRVDKVQLLGLDAAAVDGVPRVHLPILCTRHNMVAFWSVANVGWKAVLIILIL